VEDLERLFPDDYADYDATEGTGAALCAVLENADVDTVGGLLAHQLGRVPLPGSEVEVAGLHLLGEGGKDARGRVRITTVLVTPPPDESADDEAKAAFGASDAPNSAFATSETGPARPGEHTNGTRHDGTGSPAGRREETDVRPA